MTSPPMDHMITPANRDTPKRKCVVTSIESAQAELNTARTLRTDRMGTSPVCHSVEPIDDGKCRTPAHWWSAMAAVMVEADVNSAARSHRPARASSGLNLPVQYPEVRLATSGSSRW